MQEDIEELLVGAGHEVLLYDDGVEQRPVDERDEDRHGARHVLHRPGQSEQGSL